MTKRGSIGNKPPIPVISGRWRRTDGHPRRGISMFLGQSGPIDLATMPKGLLPQMKWRQSSSQSRHATRIGLQFSSASIGLW